MRNLTHDEVCAALGVPPVQSARHWLPYAVQATRVAVHIGDETHARKWGGSYRCGNCGFGLDIKPGPGTQYPEPEASGRCPKCGYDGTYGVIMPAEGRAP